MTRYVAQIDQGEDLIVEDHDLLGLELSAGWAIFTDRAGIALAIPADRIRSIQRLDEADGEGGDATWSQDEKQPLETPQQQNA